MAEPLDPILFQDKGVFASNVYELIRAHQSLANRFLAAEKKLKDIHVGDGSDFGALKQQVTDLGGSLDSLKVNVDALKVKVDTLFPEEGSTLPSSDTESKPAEPEPVDPDKVDPKPPEDAPKDPPVNEPPGTGLPKDPPVDEPVK